MKFALLKNLFGKSEEPLTGASLKKELSFSLSPLLEKIGLTKHDGEYLWYSDFNNEGIRRVFKYALMKGNTGLFTWGVCFKHVPTVSSAKKLQYHRTEKNITLHLWEWPSGYAKSLEADVKPTDLVSHVSMRECRRTLSEIYMKHASAMQRWYDRADSLPGSLEIVNEQIAKGTSYKIRWPSGNYIKIFLLALLGHKAQARELLNRSAAPAARGSAEWRGLAALVEQEIESI